MSTPKRILVVDDEEAVLLVLGDSLSKLGDQVEIVVAGSGQEALERIKEDAFSVVITDLKMPGMDGIELTQAINATCTGTTVIWMTAHGSHTFQSEATRLAIYRCLDKPLDIAEIRRIVSEALEESTGNRPAGE